MLGPVDSGSRLPPQGPFGDTPPTQDDWHDKVNELYTSIYNIYSDNGIALDNENMSRALSAIEDFMQLANQYQGQLDLSTQALYNQLTKTLPNCNFSFADIANQFMYGMHSPNDSFEAFSKFLAQDSNRPDDPLHLLMQGINAWYGNEGNPAYKPHPGTIPQDLIDDLVSNLQWWEFYISTDPKNQDIPTYFTAIKKDLSTLANLLDQEHTKGGMDGYMKDLYNMFYGPVTDAYEPFLSDIGDDNKLTQDLTTMLSNQDEFLKMLLQVQKYEYPD